MLVLSRMGESGVTREVDYNFGMGIDSIMYSYDDLMRRSGSVGGRYPGGLEVWFGKAK